MQTDFISGDKQTNFIDQVREELRKDTDPVDVRIIGNPGSGKTRIVYEITNTKDLESSVLYFKNPGDLKHNHFIQRLLREKDAHAILIVDECDIYEKNELWNHISTVSQRIKLVTIHNEKDSDQVYELPILTDKEIVKIISGYNIPIDEANRYAPSCTPSPRLANWLGQSLISNPDFSVFSNDVTSIYELFIANKLDLKSQTFLDRKSVLMWFSIFSKVGFEAPHDKEANIIAQKIEQNTGINKQRFLEIVNDLRNFKVL